MLQLWQGIEVEYAIPLAHKGVRADPGDRPRSLLRGLSAIGSPDDAPAAPFIYLKGSSGFLATGGKAYIDHVLGSDILELCTPECHDAREALLYERIGDRSVAAAAEYLRAETGTAPHCYKTAVAYDEFGNPTLRGLHESYLLPREVFAQRLRHLIPYLVIRPLFCGAGGYVDGSFVIAPRQLFVYSELSAQVPRDHPLIAKNKESHTSEEFVRLHVCNGEGARADYSTLLRQAVTTYVLECLTLDLLDPPPLADAVDAGRRLSEASDGAWTVDLADGSTIDAIDYLTAYYLEPIRRLPERRALDAADRAVLDKLDEVLARLAARDFDALSRTLDWTIKRDLIEWNAEEYFDLDAVTPDIKRGIDFQYKALTDPLIENLRDELGIESVFTDEEVKRSLLRPPANSRAAARVALGNEFPLDDMDWNYVEHNGIRLGMDSLDGWDGRSIAGAGERLRQLGAA